MIVEKELWNEIPILHVYKEEMTNETPVVIFLHGFLSAKEHNLHYAYTLVEKGVRVILPDAYLHGERTQSYSEAKMNSMFWEIVLNYIQDVGIIYEELHKRNVLTTEAIGVAGTSMGGITTAGCLKNYNWIKTAGILMGITSYTDMAQYQVRQLKEQGIEIPIAEEQQQAVLDRLAQYNIDSSLEIFERVPTIFWHGKQDNVVPYYMTYPFYEYLIKENKAHKARYILDEKAGHAVSRNGMLEVTEWLAQHLA
ncbi:prolyl oligopeptidase family serine peptidase [Lysinibacillus sp. 54212]|uniref:prolyl oligopeptidase family serine peptidase n=1 Tax=Lysinibacillus sp. 54212 TaxID=3119829 RepID=UPI002FC91D8E